MRWKYTNQDRLAGGIGHASLDLSSGLVMDEWTPFSGHDDNRSRQARLVALWDLCLGGDAQWIFDPLSDYSIWSHDHGLWLGIESDWGTAALERIGVRPWDFDLDPAVVSASALRAAASAVERLEAEQIREIVQRVPLEWKVNLAVLDVISDLLYIRVEGVVQRLLAASDKTTFA
jgi:hypothetical protein